MSLENGDTWPDSEIKPNDFNAFNEDAAPNRFIFRIACFFLEVFLID